MRTIRGAFQGGSGKQRILYVTGAVILHAAAMAVLVSYFGGTWTNYLFGVLSFAMIGVLILIGQYFQASSQKDHAPSPKSEE